jgi:hypothetical protein
MSRRPRRNHSAAFKAKVACGTLPCFECIVSRLCSPFFPPVWKYWKVGDLSDFSNRL